MAKDSAFDVSLKSFIEQLEANEKKLAEKIEEPSEWLLSFPDKAKQKLNGEQIQFKMPKTPARKKTRQQKKRVLNEDDDNHSSNDMPVKKGKLSHEEDDLLNESFNARPRRQASNAAKSKIQQSLKMTLKQKLRRPSEDKEGLFSTHDLDDRNNHPAMECDSPVRPTKSDDANRTVTIASETIVLPPSQSILSSADENDLVPSKFKVNFALEATTGSSKRNGSCELIEPPNVHQEEEVVRVCEPEEPVKENPTPVDPPKKVRPTRKAKKQEEIAIEDDKTFEVEKIKESTPPVEDIEVKRRSPEPATDLTKKKTRKVRQTNEEKQLSNAASPRLTRHQKKQESVRSSVVSIGPNSPRLDKIASKRNLLEQAATRNAQYNTPNSSPVRKVFTPKPVFSPFKPSSVKTKVEAFEAVMGSPTPALASSNIKTVMPVLPEARVLLKRLTDQELLDAGAEAIQPAIKPQINAKETNLKRGTIVLDETDKSKRKSVAQMLARKSVDKAKFVALTAARNKIINNVTHNEVPEKSESPNVHVNRNAASMLSKYRFASTASLTSSGSNLNRLVAMTKSSSSSTVGTFTGTKTLASMPIKVPEEDEQKRKEHEMRRLREKEEEAARKREELIKAKAEEQKRKHEARAKRAAEQRLLRAKQLGEEQKQKLETKEEKCALQKQKLLAENQEKTERARAVLYQRQQEAEQRRKAEELQKQEEEHLRLLAVKKEQEELAKLKQAEAEKAKIVVPPPTAAPLNTTVTLPSSVPVLSYEITPQRVTKLGKIYNPDNYDLTDMRSDDSTDDESRPKKVIPSWARSVNMKVALRVQASRTTEAEVENIFPPEALQKEPDLNDIFKIKRARFDKRTSSAVWKTPPSHYL